jgi:sporulation protein YlmC with PRC-barrel domain
MTTETEFTIGETVRCTDGECGELRKVVIDPVQRAVTHLVVEARHREGLGKLVPLDLVATPDPVLTLGCTTAQFAELEDAEAVQFLPGGAGLLGYESPDAIALPYYLLGANDVTPPEVEDAVPAGEVALRRDEPVHATDGEIGRVDAFVVDPASGRVTHVVLQEGHLWGSHDVAIPIEHVTSMSNGIVLDLSKDDVRDLPTVTVERHHR